jgi:L-ribulose-5-phosphate 3-epimerase
MRNFQAQLGAWSAPTPDSMWRRDFLRAATGALVTASMSSVAARGAGNPRVAFNTANLVARVSNYQYELENWMDQHRKTVAGTDAAAWRSICREIAGAGYNAVEIWEAHASPEVLDRARAAQWKSILKEFGLRPVAYAGTLRRETLEICRWLQIPHIDGGMGNLKPEQATALCAEYKIGFNIENHPEKTAEELLAKIGGGNRWLGACIDTGWFGTQGASVPAMISACGALVRHTHIKDVKVAGKHETCLLGEGIVNVAECMKTLQSMKYSGWYSWEDEPEDRNPFDSARRNREWMEKHLALKRS